MKEFHQALVAAFGDAVAESGSGLGHSTFTVVADVLATVRCCSEGDVARAVEIAQRFGVPVHPVSRGTNWGYGGGAPFSSGALCLDLRGMTEIRGYDATYGAVTVEPGVTFEALEAFLAAQKSPYFLNILGGSPYSSVLANALERGHGVGPYADRVSAVRSLRAVLADGTVLDTAPGGAPGASLHPYGAGPWLTPAFTQSNFGIVTAMTMVLAPTPKFHENLAGWLFTDEQIQGFFDAVRDAHYRGELVVRTGHRFLARDPKKWPTRAEEYGYPLNVSLPYYAETSAGLLAARAEVRARTRPFLQEPMVFGNHPSLKKPGVRIAHRWQDDARFAAPTQASVAAIYRVLPALPKGPLDPGRDGVGLFWSTPVVPMDGNCILELVREAEQIALRHRVEPDISLLSILDWRNLDGIFGFLFARGSEEEARARQAFDELEDFLQQRRYPSYRLGVQHSSKTALTADRQTLIGHFRRGIDPNALLSRGRF